MHPLPDGFNRANFACFDGRFLVDHHLFKVSTRITKQRADKIVGTSFRKHELWHHSFEDSKIFHDWNQFTTSPILRKCGAIQKCFEIHTENIFIIRYFYGM